MCIKKLLSENYMYIVKLGRRLWWIKLPVHTLVNNNVQIDNLSIVTQKSLHNAYVTLSHTELIMCQSSKGTKTLWITSEFGLPTYSEKSHYRYTYVRRHTCTCTLHKKSNNLITKWPIYVWIQPKVSVTQVMKMQP